MQGNSQDISSSSWVESRSRQSRQILVTDKSAIFFKKINQIEEAISKQIGEETKNVVNLPTAESTKKENNIEAKTEKKISSKASQRILQHHDL